MTPDFEIPFNRVCLAGNEIERVVDAIRSGHISGDGAYTKKCQNLLAEIMNIPGVLLTTSGTHALEMMALLLEIQSGDEVIVPSFTFASTINAFVLRGARPVFADIRSDTLNLDETLLPNLITTRTKAIVTACYGGVACEMDDILKLAGSRGVAVVEDAAQGLFGKYKGKYLGTFGRFAAQSFHGTKNFTCGEGGALFINDSKDIARAEILREKGTNRNQFFRGQVDKYTWVDLGSSYVPSDILGAFLYAQLEAREQIQAARRGVWEYYGHHLRSWADSRDVGLPAVPEHCEQPYHLFYLLMPSEEQRRSLMAHLKAKRIATAFHYLPLHVSDMGRRFGGKPGDCPVAEDVSNRLLRLPFYNDLTEAELAYVVSAIEEFDGQTVD